MQYNRVMQNIYQTKGETLVDQYLDAGRVFSKEIRASIEKIGKKRSKLTNARRVVAERTWENLRTKEAVRELRSCLSAWSEGAGITERQAMWAMADNLSGCQTFMARYGSGVALLHSEEEFRDATHIDLHMTSPHTMEFRDGGRELKTLVYNDLLPGAGLYGWKNGMLVAVDSLFLREDGIDKVQSPLLANIVSWLIWRMEPSEAEPKNIVELVETLGELIDGYAINVVRKVQGVVEGYKLTFARSEQNLEYLGQKNGDYLRQVNIIDPHYSPMRWALPARNIWRGGYKYFVNRLKVMDQDAKVYKQVGEIKLKSEEVEVAHSQIQKLIFGQLQASYINSDVGAVCVGLVDQCGTSVSAKLNDSRDVGVLEYIDRL